MFSLLAPPLRKVSEPAHPQKSYILRDAAHLCQTSMSGFQVVRFRIEERTTMLGLFTGSLASRFRVEAGTSGLLLSLRLGR